jgi:conjugal transfer/entry exclusion protein
MDNARSALQSSLILQAQTTEQLRDDQTSASSVAGGCKRKRNRRPVGAAGDQRDPVLQAQQAMRLQALLVAQSRAEALERAREMEVQAQARAQHAHFFGGARRRIPKPALALRPRPRHAGRHMTGPRP